MSDRDSRQFTGTATWTDLTTGVRWTQRHYINGQQELSTDPAEVVPAAPVLRASSLEAFVGSSGTITRTYPRWRNR